MLWLGLSIGFLSGTVCGLLLSSLVRAVRTDADDHSKKKWVAGPLPLPVPWRQIAFLIAFAIVVYGLIAVFFE
jgi:ABC-type lipoprotein release transport system permease subunit